MMGEGEKMPEAKGQELISVTLTGEQWEGLYGLLLELAEYWEFGIEPAGGVGSVPFLMNRLLPFVSTAAGLPEAASMEGRLREHFGTPVPENVLAVARGVVKQIPDEYWQEGEEDHG